MTKPMIVFPDGVIQEQYALGDVAPGNWAADEVIYRLLSYVDPGDGPRYYYAARKNFTPVEVPDIVKFVKALAQGKSTAQLVTDGAKRLQTSARSISKLPSAWDIDVFHKCYIVLELDRTKKWTFQSDFDGVTTNEKHDDEYFYLKHVSQAGDVLAGPPADADMCRILYFSVDTPQGYRSDKFNISVQFPQAPGQAPQGSTFDPDIKNNGGPPVLPFV
jgi:hypothetical protein